MEASSTENDPPVVPKIDCTICNKDLTKLNIHNRNTHITACRKNNPQSKKQAPKRKTKSLYSFFVKAPKLAEVSEDIAVGVEDISEVSEDITPEDIASNSDSVDEVAVLLTYLVNTVVGTMNEVVQVHDIDSETEAGEVFGEQDGDNNVDFVADVIEMDVVQPTSKTTQVTLKFCVGYIPSGFNILQNFPFQTLDSCSFIVSKKRFHAMECGNRNFVMDLNIDGDISWECAMLKEDASLRRILQRSESDDPTSHIHDSFLSYNQLKQKLDFCKGKLSLFSIEKYKLSQKAERLGKTLSFHKRLLCLIAENKIPRLHFLVNVALKNRRSIEYIVGKCTEAIAGVYRARVDQDDKELAFLVLKFGGPSLLDILFRANLLPSTSLAYRMSKAGPHLQTSVKLSFTECFQQNFKLEFGENENEKYGLSIKSDETYINPRLRYNPKSNEIVGVCYEHHESINLNFNCLEDAHDLQKKLAEDKVHVPKECLVTGISSVVKNIPFQVILMWPTCSKDDFNGMSHMYMDISDAMKEKIGANPLNFNTDGDSTRRQAMHAITQHDLDLDSDLGKTISSLALVDRKVGKNQETVNYDAKHLVKRCWTSLISGKMEVGGVVLTKKDVEVIIEGAERRTHKVQSLVYPNDKQHVPHATDCLLSFIEVVRDQEKRKKIPFKLTMVLNELNLVAAVYECLVCLYSYVTCSLTEQVELIAKGASSLLALFREASFKIPNQLYHDIQCTFNDTVYCISKLQINAPDSSFYTSLDGTDPEERFFGNARMAFGHKNLDAYELSNSASSIAMCDDILQKHPEWVKKGRVSRRLVLDHSNCKDWTGDLIVSHVNLSVAWKVGLLHGQTLAVKANYDFEPTLLGEMGVTLQRPYGRVVGVSEREIDWSIPDPEPVVEETGNSENDENDVELSEIIESNSEVYLEIGGKNVYKASILKQVNKEVPLSADRLRKVRGLSKFVGSEKSQTDLNDAISIGDPLIVEHEKKMKVTVVVKILDGDHNKEFVNSADLQNLSMRVVVKELKLKEADANLYSTGEYASEVFTVSGKNCMTVKPDVSLDPPEGCSIYFFDKQLIQDIGVHLTLLDSNQQHGSRSTSSSSMLASTSGTTSTSVSSSAPASASASATMNEVTCKICKKKKIPLKDMRTHVGKHIIKNEAGPGEHICGFCGKDGCKPSLEKSSSSKSKVFHAPKSDCLYHYTYKKLGQKATKYTPCINRITTCPICNMYIWSYNLVPHYQNVHPEENSDELKIPNEEKVLLNKSKI